KEKIKLFLILIRSNHSNPEAEKYYLPLCLYVPARRQAGMTQIADLSVKILRENFYDKTRQAAGN
ncbi:MAG: hypothetical protein KAW82_05620, partial [Desulfurellaceae bacterium]|nr:hypothetical protein [Desulfurellaceae bacterium]